MSAAEFSWYNILKQENIPNDQKFTKWLKYMYKNFPFYIRPSTYLPKLGF
jgi:hypothetical protein